MEEHKTYLKHLNEISEAAGSCVQCGQCRAAIWASKGIRYVCPVYKTNMISTFESFNPRGKNIILKGLLWGDLELTQELADIVFQCSLCGACENFCHNSFNDNINFANHQWMEQIKAFEALRADLVEAGFPIEAHIPMNKALIEFLNPYGQDNKEKAKWTNQLDFPIKDMSKKKSDLIYFAGCTVALTPQIQNLVISTAKTLQKLGIDFAVFGDQEVCCGSVAMRTGDRAAFEAIAQKNADLFKKNDVKRIVTSCAGCYRTLKKDYGDKLDGIQILHMIELLDEFFKKNTSKLKKLDIITTYHDPCHLGRHMGLYESPRNVLKQISNFVEMPTFGSMAMCCGAGGGVKKGFPELSLEMAKNRVKEAEETGASVLISTCPFCYRNLSDAILALRSSIKMMDLVELVLEALNY